MSQSLVINGKKYIPSGVVAAEVNYSSDYISKLAREERILGTQIGRQWFIEPHSLKTYLAQIKIEKEISKEQLRRVRKLEHKTPVKNTVQTVDAKQHSIFDFAVLAQAFAVVMCGLFLGSLVWLTEVEALSSSDVAVGAEKLASYVVQSVYPFDLSKYFSDDTRSFTAASAESAAFIVKDARVEDGALYTQLPQFPLREIEVESYENRVRVQNQFSDEVVATDDVNGAIILKPVFKNRVPNGDFFIVTPVTKTY